MAPYIITVLIAALLQSGCKLALLPRRWRWTLPILPALLPPLAQSRLLTCGRPAMERLLDSAPELEALCVIAVTQELASLAAGWPLIAGNCRFRRWRRLALAPSLLLLPGVLYAQMNGFLHLPGVPFRLVTAGVALAAWLLPALIAEGVARLRRTPEERLETLLSAEWLLLLLTLFLPVFARGGEFRPGTEEPDFRSFAVLGVLTLTVAGFALLTQLRISFKNRKTP